jgi:catechol 2,3-dioxygenase-like lactoylglutathione lyase family enzyme
MKIYAVFHSRLFYKTRISLAATIIFLSLCTVSAFAQDESGRLALVGRIVANLDQSVEFYQALGFVKDEAESHGWNRDETIEALFGVNDIETRVAKMQINSNASGLPYPVYLREVRGVDRRNLAVRSMWKPTSTHIGLIVDNARQTWTELRELGILRPHSWADELQPAGRTSGQLAYIADPDGLDVEIIDKGEDVPPTNGNPGRSSIKTGISHFGIVVSDINKAREFYVGLLGGKMPATEPEWLKGDFYDAAVGGHGGIVRLYFLTFAEAVAPDSRLNFELIDFQNRKQPIDEFSITDIGVHYNGFQVPNLESFIERAVALGATQVSKDIVTLADGTREVMLRDSDTSAYVIFLQRP